MHPASLEIDPLLSVFAKAIFARGWCKSTDSSLIAIQSLLWDEGCLFRAMLRLDREDEPILQLSAATRSILQQLTQAGVSLFLHWPRSQNAAVDEWLGRRFYFSASTNFTVNERYVSLVSSQLGRHGSKIPNWPSLVDAALKNARRDHERPLILPGTSLSEATQQFSDRADLSNLKIQVDDRKTIEDWLNDVLSELEQAYATRALDSTARQALSLLRLSPPKKQPPAPELVSFPLQDRVAFALADRVLAIHVRNNGTIAHLAERRLSDSRFPTGSVYIASTFGPQSICQHGFEFWLERGAVGWMLPEPAQQPDHLLLNCRNKISSPFTQTLCSPMPEHWFNATWSEGEWPFLTHCTRGNSGPQPNESLEHFRDRAWSAGVIPNSLPLSTLQQILNDNRIKGNSWLTRSQQPCVSLSEVPLAELLSRRRFRSHLGRWDWEPYGILIHREALERLGGRPVLYGDEAEYKQLADDDKPYFQPRGNKTARNNQDWSIEREWRLCRDLNFAEVPRESIIVFVATETEAQQVSRRCQWPVVWVCRSLGF